MIITCPGCGEDIEAENFSRDNECPKCRCVYDMMHDCYIDDGDGGYDCMDYAELVRKAEDAVR